MARKPVGYKSPFLAKSSPMKWWQIAAMAAPGIIKAGASLFGRKKRIREQREANREMQAARQAYRAMTPEQLKNFGALTQYGEGITRRQFIDQYNMGGQALDLYNTTMAPTQGYGTY